MRFVSRSSFRRLGCDFTEVCEITGEGVILRSHEIKPLGLGREITAPYEITPSRVKSQESVKSYAPPVKSQKV